MTFYAMKPTGIYYCSFPKNMGNIFEGNGKETGGGRLPDNPQARTGTELHNSTQVDV